jgi:hypothetical protein
VIIVNWGPGNANRHGAARTVVNGIEAGFTGILGEEKMVEDKVAIGATIGDGVGFGIAELNSALRTGITGEGDIVIANGSRDGNR